MRRPITIAAAMMLASAAAAQDRQAMARCAAIKGDLDRVVMRAKP
jgi:hypothetical protein